MGDAVAKADQFDEVIVRARIPGITPEDVKIEIEDGVLTVSGEHEEQSEEEKDGYTRRERRFGSFRRRMHVPAGVDADQIKVEAHDGVLEVRLPVPEQADE